MKGFIVNSSYGDIEEKTQVYFFGRLENDQSFVSVIDFQPYFFIENSDLKKSKPLLSKFKAEKTILTTFQGRKVSRITAKNQTDLNKLIKALQSKKIKTYEADLRPDQRLAIDLDVKGSIEIQGDFESSEIFPKVDRIYKNPEIKSSGFKPKLRLASIDIESDKKLDNLFCIGIYTEKEKKVFMVTKKKIENVIPCKDEKDCLEKFRQEIIALDPDIITGWNVIDFDLQYLKSKFEKNEVPFDLGRDNSQSRIRIESHFFRSSSATIHGRQVLDGLNLIKDPFIKEAPSIKYAKFNSYSLEDVSKEILKQGKTIKGKERHNEIEILYKRGEHKKLAEYNIQDCKLAYNILDRTKVIDLAVERAMLTGMPLDRITASIASFDSLYIRKARKEGLVSPTTVFKERKERIKGGYVMNSKPGIYHDVLVLDFKSLYPSIIKTFNIDPASFLEKKEKNSIQSPNNAYFKNQEGILPEIISELHESREKAKKEGRELSSYAIKIIMNSFFGVLASPNCRYYSLSIANAITHFGQKIIKLTAKKIEEENYKVVYSDTDSVFVDTNNSGRQEALRIGRKIQEYINNFYEDYVKRNYGRKSFLELEFQKHYLSFLLPAIRDSDIGSKKRYAGLILKPNKKEELHIVGLEAIRGDWTEAAKEFQKELLKKVFRKKNFFPFIKDYVKSLRAGEIDEKLVYKKSITKSLEKYVKTTPPHVKAARQLDKLESNIIQYYITIKGPEPAQKRKHKIDYEHYVRKQIEPIANTILFFFHKDFDEILKGDKQMKLF